MREKDSNLRINFETTYVLSFMMFYLLTSNGYSHQPHITLYMTDFLDEKIPEVVAAVRSVTHQTVRDQIKQLNGYQVGLIFS